MDWQQTTLRPPFHPLSDALHRADPPADAALISLMRPMENAWAILDAQLARHAFVAGDTLTMADIPFCYIVNRWYRLPIEHRGLANVKAWYDRLCQRPAFRRNVYDVG